MGDSRVAANDALAKQALTNIHGAVLQHMQGKDVMEKVAEEVVKAMASHFDSGSRLRGQGRGVGSVSAGAPGACGTGWRTSVLKLLGLNVVEVVCSKLSLWNSSLLQASMEFSHDFATCCCETPGRRL